MSIKALFFGFDKSPFKDMEQLIKIAKTEASKILGNKKIKVLNIVSCSYPSGYVVVVESPGREGRQKEKK